MKTCPNCGQTLPDDAMFCGNCGTPLSQQSQSEPQASQPDIEQPKQETPPSQPDSFCPNCGERIQGSAPFCPNCGTRLEPSAPETPAHSAKPKKRVFMIGVCAAAVLLLVVIGAFALPSLFSSPHKEFVQIQQDLFVDRMMDQLEETLDIYGSGQFSSDLILSASVDASEIDRFLEDSSIGLKLDLNRDSLIAEGQFVLMGSPVLNAAVTYDKGQLGFSLPEVDDHYYVMDLSSMVYNLTGQEVDLSQLALPEISGKQWRSLVQSYLDIVYTVVTKDNVEVQKGESVRLEQLDRRFDGTVYTFTPSGEDVEAMCVEIARHLREDETLRSLILNLVSPETLEAAFGANVFGGYDLEDQLDEAILSLADTLEEQASDVGREVERSGFTWTLVTEQKEVRMIRLEAGGQALVYERDGSESDGASEALYLDSADYSQVLLQHDYTKDGSNWKGSVTVTLPYESTFTMDYKLDEAKRSALGVYYGTYDMSIPDEGIRFSLEVQDGGSGGVDHILSINNCQSLFYAPFDYLELTINATDKSSAQKPSGDTVDLSDYSPAELEALFYDLGSVLQQDLINNLEPLFYDLYFYF